MKRFAIGVVGVAAIMVLATPASARVRTDPNDTSRPLDIRTVATRRSSHRLIVWFGTWDALRATDLRTDGFEMWLDTTGDRGFDRVISTVVERGHVMCAVYEVQPTSLVDQDRAHRPSRRRTGCSVPRSWFEIAAPVRFRVDTFERHGDTATVVDRAPNHGRYLGL